MYWLPACSMRSPRQAARAISMISRVRASGALNGTPWKPSITCGPEAPSPSSKRPPEMVSRVAAVIAISVGVRE